MRRNLRGEDEEESQHAINRDLLTEMEMKLSGAPELLNVGAGRDTCSIFKVPQSLIDTNGKSYYEPHVISIGPFHHGHPDLQMIEEHKWRFLRQLLNRTRTKGLVLEGYLKAVQPLEQKARECYSKTIRYDTDEFIKMLILDSCFIIELFRKVGTVVPFEDNDPLDTMSWIYDFFSRDLVKLENQVPFFVLQRLFDLTMMPGEDSSLTLATLALWFFNPILERPENVLKKYANVEAKHLLDLLRSTYLTPELKEDRIPDIHLPKHLIPCISKLRRAGIKLKPCKADSILMVTFKHGVIHMPPILIDDFMCVFLLNSVAYEQCHAGCSKHVTTYVTLFDFLVNTPKDVEHLCDWNIIENYLGTDEEVARFLSNIGKEIGFDVNSCYLARLFNDVNRYYQSDLHVQWAGFINTYFDTPWSFVSALAALILLILTVTQTVYTVLG